MKRVTGLGGVFFKTPDPDGLKLWYRKHLGIESDQWGFAFLWRELAAPQKKGYTVWGPFSDSTKYFDPSDEPYMINYRVDDLEALLTAPAYGGNTDGIGWRWLEYVPGFPLPGSGTRYPELPL